MMNRLCIALSFLTLSPALLVAQPILGFRAERLGEERALESKFDSYLNRDDLRTWLKRLSARPHHIGSAYDKANAEFIASLYKSWGFETSIEEFQVLFPTPKTRVLEMLAPEKFTPKLAEPPLPEDSTSGQTSEQLPIYNAYSIDGDVTGDLVYVNYGVPKDYEELEKNGIDVKGKIVISRYGGAWRGIKPKVAAEHGAIGCIIYSDPRDDGYYEGDVYPKGAYRSEDGAQRGSVLDMPVYSGDPLTPGIGATKDAKRLALKDVTILTKIPVLPISYADALPLLRAMGGPVVPDEWRGALPITYHIGPGPTKVHLKLEFNWDIVPIYDVIAKIAGSERPDEWIVRGNHHDAWVNGASDPLSGQVATLEEARGLGELARHGWKPKRTVIYCAWDGEEEGLLGSTEWAETHADALKQKAVVYINSDSNGRGYLFAGGTDYLGKLVSQAARDVTDPETHVSTLERDRARTLVDGSPEDKREALQNPAIRLSPLGSGSDFTPFLQHLGIASLNIGYGGEGGGGSYHSVYDSYDHYVRFSDGTFQYGIALAQTGGRIVLRLADADILPFAFSDFGNAIAKYAKELSKLTDDMREETEQQNRLISDKSYERVADPRQTYVAPKPKDRVPYLNFSPLQNSVAALELRVKEFDEQMKKVDDRKKQLDTDQEQSLDDVLLHAERSLIQSEGLPRRPWYTHEIYAPGFYTGYDVKTMPGIREAIEQRNWSEAADQVSVVAKAIDRFSDQLDRATNLLKKAMAE